MFGRSRTWRSFCGVDQETFERCLRTALDDLGFDAEREERPGSFMLGEEPASRYEIALPDAADPAVVQVFFASGDPMLRALSSFRATPDTDLGGVCVVQVSIPEGGETAVTRLMRATVEELPRDPADVAHHPRFRVAFLGRWRIRRKWRRWTVAED